MILIFLLVDCELMLILLTKPATGYELSIYGAYSWLFWLCFFSSVLLCIFTFFYVLIKQDETIWYWGLIGIILNYTIFLLLPSIRGYYFFAVGNDDVFSHLAWANEIIQTGHIFNGDIYPASHIHAALFYDLGIPLNFSAVFIPALFSILLILFFYSMSRSLNIDSKFSLLMLIFATPLLFSYFTVSFHPFMFSIFLLPLIIYCIHRGIGGNHSYSIIFFLLVAAIVFFHPLTSIISISILGIYFIISYVIKGDFGKNFQNRILLFSIFGLVSFTIWYLYNSNILGNVKEFLDAFVDSSDRTILTHYSAEVSSSTASYYKIVETFIKYYGSISLYLVFACICLVYVIYSIYQKKNIDKGIVFGSLFVFGIVFALVTIVFSSVIFELVRALAPAIILGISVIVICFDHWFKEIQDMQIIIFILAVLYVLISSVIILGVMIVYESPWTATPGKQMSYMDNAGVSWLLNEKSLDKLVYVNNNKYSKMEMYSEGIKHYYGQQIMYRTDKIPSHFGYLTEYHLDKRLKLDAAIYMVTNEKMRQVPLAVSPENRNKVNSFTPQDFFRLNNDNSVQSIYQNKEFEVWIVD